MEEEQVGLTIMDFLNPWELTALPFLGTYGIVRFGTFFIDKFCIVIAKVLDIKKLPTRIDNDHKILKTSPKLDLRSKVYLLINSVNDLIILSNLTHFIYQSPDVETKWQRLQPLNAIVGLFMIFFIQDAIYAPLHRLMHWGPIYPYIHKHHHRSVHPHNGFVDAANYNPIEHLLGNSAVVGAVLGVTWTIGTHFWTILVFYTFHAIMAVFNHTDYDVEFNWLGFHYSSRSHEMHHRFSSVNYGHYVMIWDKLMGTFRPYK